MPVTYFFVGLTVLVSLAAFKDAVLLNKLIMFPFGMRGTKDYYRLLTSGFIHADGNHLLFNMFTLFFFGQNAESVFEEVSSPNMAPVLYGLLYITAIIVSSLPALIKHRNHSYYRSLGASGGVSAILFFVIYYFPWAGIRIMFIPIGIPAIMYGVAYTLYSAYMSKKGNDNIGHDAHLGGGIYGFIFAFLVDPSHGLMFIDQMMHPKF